MVVPSLRHLQVHTGPQASFSSVQAARLEALERFRTGEAKLLLATDVAARGLDILGVETVVNLDCPPTVEAYLHRIGRTARAGATGCAITFVTDADRALVKAMGKRVGARLAARTVPAAVVAKWRQVAESLWPQVDEVLAVRSFVCVPDATVVEQKAV